MIVVVHKIEGEIINIQGPFANSHQATRYAGVLENAQDGEFDVHEIKPIEYPNLLPF